MKSIIICYIMAISYLFAHCQVPCGIYDDARKIIEIEEDIMTIKKAMNNIQLISNQNMRTAQEMNQLVRWITTKEDHAQHIQNTIMEYFLSQRIKPKELNDIDYLKYVSMTTLCQQIIFYAMKTKQSADIKHLGKLSNILNELENIYFDNHGIEHLNNLRNN